MLTNFDKQLKRKEAWERIIKLTQGVDYGSVDIVFRNGLPIRIEIKKQIQINDTEELDSISLG